MIEAQEREIVDREITSKFTTMRIDWEANAIEGGGDGVVFKCNAPMVKDGGHMKEFAGHAFHEAIRVKLGLSAVCEKKLAKKASLAALDEAAMDDDVNFDAPEFKMRRTKRRGNKEFADH